MASWNHKTLKKLYNSWGFVREIFKILFRKDSWRHRPTCCVQISWNLADGKSVKSCINLPDKKKQKFAWFSSSRYCADRAQGWLVGWSLTPLFSTNTAISEMKDRAQNLSGSAPVKIRRVLLISTKSVHFRRSCTRTREHHQNGP